MISSSFVSALLLAALQVHDSCHYDPSVPLDRQAPGCCCGTKSLDGVKLVTDNLESM